MRKIATTFITFMVVVTAAAAVFGQGKPLADTEWKLVAANGVRVTNSNASVAIDEDRRKFTGSTGCNQMFGSLFVRGRNIDFTDIGTTKRMCKLMPGNVAEDVFLKALRDTVRYSQTGNALSLLDRRGRTVLRFTRILDREPSVLSKLDDRKWVLEQIKNQQTFAPLPYAFVNFDANRNSVGGDSGCNVFGGEYRVNGTSITITDVISTMRACVEDNKMSVQRDLFDGLRTARRFEIKGGRLMLYRGNQLLLTFRGEKK
jgi:heat shock protein HslJ